MSNVLIDRQKIDILANAISDKSGVPITMTLAEMVEAVDGIETGGGEPSLQSKTKSYTPTESAQTESVSADSGYDGLDTVSISVGAIDSNYVGTGITRRDDTDLYGVYQDGAYTVGGPGGYYQYAFHTTVPDATYVDPISVPLGTHTINVDSDGVVWSHAEIGGNISPISQSGYAKSTDTLFAYASTSESYQLSTQAATTITPTESSQTAVAAGKYTTGAVTVNAIPSNYVGSGITQRSSSDLTASGATVTVPSGYYSAQASKAVASGTAGTPTATKGTVSNHQVSVTPSVTNTAGYISGGTINGTAVTVTASELVSGSQTITSNQTVDVTNLAEVVVNVASGSSKNTQVVQSTTRTNASTLTAIGAELTVSKTGTYDIYYSCFRTNTSASYTWATRLYINGTAYGTAENATWTNNQQNTHLSNISLTADDKLRVYGRNTRGTSYYVCAPMLVIIEA